MERIRDNRPRGMNRNLLRTWALLMAAAGLLGRGLLQAHILGIGAISAEELLEVMNASEEMMVIATVSLVLQAVETCAVPIFALLLAEGFIHTSSFQNYFLRIAGCALLSEVPFDLAMSGKVLDFSRQSPVFAMLLCLVMLYLFRRFEGKGFLKLVMKVLIVVCAVIWTEMLRIDMGVGIVLLVWPMYVFRQKPLYRNLMAAGMAITCTLTSVFFILAPMGCLMLHFYTGEKSEEEPSRIVTYLAYPVMALAVALVGMFVL